MGRMSAARGGRHARSCAAQPWTQMSRRQASGQCPASVRRGVGQGVPCAAGAANACVGGGATVLACAAQSGD